MAVKLKGNACIGQSGGPTVVINQSLVGAVLEARKHDEIEGFLGARHGVQGIMDEDFVDLFNVPDATLEKIAATPSAALGSVRLKPGRDECEKIFKVFQKHNVRYFFYIGGDDSSKTAHIVNTLAEEAQYEFRTFHIPKTIDNDLMENDHTPGYGSAARFVASAVMGDDLDNRSIPGIKVDIIMGRNAGWLTAASVLGRTNPDDGPHLVYLPEVNVPMQKFLGDVEQVFKARGRCVVAVSEGLRDENGRIWAERLAEESEADLQSDAFGHFQLSGTGALADYLTARIKAAIAGKKKLRIRGDTFGYLQRSFAGFASPVDQAEARQVGTDAVRYACVGDVDGSVTLKREEGSGYRTYTEVVELEAVAGKCRSVPAEFITPDENNITDAFVEYALPLTGGLPEIGHL